MALGNFESGNYYQPEQNENTHETIFQILNALNKEQPNPHIFLLDLELTIGKLRRKEFTNQIASLEGDISTLAQLLSQEYFKLKADLESRRYIANEQNIGGIRYSDTHIEDQLRRSDFEQIRTETKEIIDLFGQGKIKESTSTDQKNELSA